MQHIKSSTLHTLSSSGALIKGLVKGVKVALNEKYEFFPRKIGALEGQQWGCKQPPSVEFRCTNTHVPVTMHEQSVQAPTHRPTRLGLSVHAHEPGKGISHVDDDGHVEALQQLGEVMHPRGNAAWDR